MLRADRTAEGFDGLPDGVTSPGQLLAALKAAEKLAHTLGGSQRHIAAISPPSPISELQTAAE